MRHRSAILPAAVLCHALSLGAVEAPRVTLEAAVDRPDLGLYVHGEPVRLDLRASGLAPGPAATAAEVAVVDEHDREIARHRLAVDADATGRWSASLDLPAARLGFYRVRARLGEAVPPRLGSRPAGFITYAVVADPAGRPLFPPGDSRFGLQGSFVPPGTQALLGVRWMLSGRWSWQDLAGSAPDSFPARRAEAIAAGRRLPEPVHAAARLPDGRPWTVYPVAVRVMKADPAWGVTVPETAVSGIGRLTAEGERRFAEHCLAVGRAAAEDLPDMPERFYEITWEPVYPWGFKGTDADLVRIFALAHEALHRADPRAVVIGPTFGHAPEIPDYERLLAAGLFRHLDGISIHPYIGLPPERHGLREKITALRTWMRERLGRELALYATEQGFPTEEREERELVQAQGLVRGQLILAGEGFRFSFGFYSVDYVMGAERGYGYHYNLSPTQNWNPAAWGPKPVSPAFSALTAAIDGHQPVGAIDWLGDSTLGYAFQRGEAVVLALWDWSGRPRPVAIPVGVAAVQVRDWMGNERTVACPDGQLRLDLGEDPVYVLGAAARLWGANGVRPLAVAEARITAFPGGAATLTARLAASDRPLAGTLSLVPERALGTPAQARPVALAAGGQGELAFSLPIPAGTAPGSYGVTLVLADGGTALAGSGCLVEVRAPVTVAAVQGGSAAGRGPTIAVRLREERGLAVAGSLSVALGGVPESARRLPAVLAPRQEATVTVAYPADLDLDPLRSYPCTVTVEDGRSAPATVTRPITCAAATRRASAPRIDGDLADWAGVPAWHLGGKEWAVRRPERCRGLGDLSADLRYAWDDACLYVAATVRDDIFCQPYAGFPTWRADCLQLAVDLDHGRVIALTGNELIDQDQRARRSEIDLALTPEGPQAYRTVACRPSLPVGPVAAAALPLAITRRAVAGGVEVVYEAAIPWAVLGGSPPRAGDAIGIAGTVNDIDDAAETEPWALGWFALKDPERFGRLVLAP